MTADRRAARRGALRAFTVAAAFSASTAAAAEPLYSSIKPEDCVLYDLFEQGAATACKGLGGYSLAISDADARIYLSILHPDWEAPAKIDLMKITGGAFSSLPSDLAEWRGAKSAPTALILRIGYSKGDGAQNDQALAVIRLDKRHPAKTCLVGSIPLGPEMNSDARALADAADNAPCL